MPLLKVIAAIGLSLVALFLGVVVFVLICRWTWRALIQPPHSVGRHRLSVALLVSVFVLYGAVGFLLYRGRCVSDWAFCESDLVIFALPFLLAFVANASILLFWLRPHSLARVAGLLSASFVLAALGWWAYMVCAVNTYGE